jgi:hypothetical protein
MSCSVVGAAPWFDRCWNPGQQITVRAGASALSESAAIQSAVDQWNAVLISSSTPDVPRFLYTSSGNANLVIEKVGTAAQYCGDESGGVITLRAVCGPGAYRGDVTAIVMHELTEPLGFQSAMEGQGVSGFSDHCVNVLPPGTNQVNDYPCRHELDIIRRGYGYGSPIDGQTYMGRHILTGFHIAPSSLAFSDTNQTSQVTALGPRFDLGHPSLVEPAVAVRWTSDRPQVVSVDPTTGVVTSKSSGTARIFADPLSLPAGVAITTFRQEDDFSVPVIVTLPPPPPPPPFRVTGLSGISAPITSADDETVTALVSGAPGAVQVKWRFIWSVGADGSLYDTLTTPWTGTTTTVAVHAGSYTLSILATPRSGTTPGGAYSADYPVCTSGPPPARKGQQRPQGC